MFANLQHMLFVVSMLRRFVLRFLTLGARMASTVGNDIHFLPTKDLKKQLPMHVPS